MILYKLIHMCSFCMRIMWYKNLPSKPEKIKGIRFHARNKQKHLACRNIVDTWSQKIGSTLTRGSMRDPQEKLVWYYIMFDLRALNMQFDKYVLWWRRKQTPSVACFGCLTKCSPSPVHMAHCRSVRKYWYTQVWRYYVLWYCAVSQTHCIDFLLLVYMTCVSGSSVVFKTPDS